jgi:hypothetical protein
VAIPAAGRLDVSLRHRINAGTLRVLVDGASVLEGGFAKKAIDPAKVTRWESVSIPAGTHAVSARVVGHKGKAYELGPVTLHVEPGVTSGLALVIRDGDLAIDTD